MLNEAITKTLIVALFAWPTLAYVVNAVKFNGCDFKADYRCEIVHGIGLIPSPAAIITVWFDTDTQ